MVNNVVSSGVFILVAFFRKIDKNKKPNFWHVYLVRLAVRFVAIAIHYSQVNLHWLLLFAIFWIKFVRIHEQDVNVHLWEFTEKNTLCVKRQDIMDMRSWFAERK